MENTGFGGEQIERPIFELGDEELKKNEPYIISLEENVEVTDSPDRIINVSMPPVEMEQSEEDLSVVENNISDMAKDGEGVDRRVLRILKRNEKETTGDPKERQTGFTWLRIHHLRHRYENRADYLLNKEIPRSKVIDLASIEEGGARKVRGENEKK